MNEPKPSLLSAFLPIHWRSAAFWALLLVGSFFRLYGLGHVPAGLNSDEASSGVEALALLKTGMDRWGNPWPVWFPAWGSGMNALYTYIAIPVVALFGLKIVALRAIGAVFGILTLPVAYQAARLHFGKDSALLTLAFLALLPWHLMSSRWALDSNLAPLFFTLGLWTIGKSLRDSGSWPFLAFVPWAVAIYAYPAIMPAEGLAGAGILILFRHQIWKARKIWGAGLLLALIVDLPFLLFLAKNQLHLAALPFEKLLPFTVPILPASRLSQIRGSIVETTFENLVFLVSGFRDGALWHHSVWFAPFTGAAPLLILTALCSLFLRSRLERKPNVILIVLLAAIPILLVLPQNVTRFNWFYIPAMMAVAALIIRMTGPNSVIPLGLRRVLTLGFTSYFAISTALFIPYYFTRYNDELPALDRELGNGFRIGLEPALQQAVALSAPGAPILVAVGTVHPYLYILFFGLADIQSFQKTRAVSVVDGVYDVSSFDRFYFKRDALRADSDFVFVSRTNALPCAAPQDVTTGALWAVGRCPATTRQ